MRLDSRALFALNSIANLTIIDALIYGLKLRLGKPAIDAPRPPAERGRVGCPGTPVTPDGAASPYQNGGRMAGDALRQSV